MPTDIIYEGGTLTPNRLTRSTISRRSAIKTAALATAAAIGGGGIVGSMLADKAVIPLAQAEPRVAKALLYANEELGGRFTPDKYGPIRSVTGIARTIEEKIKVEARKTGTELQACRIIIRDRQTGDIAQVDRGDVKDSFPVASVVKVVICNEAYNSGFNDGHTYLTRDLAERILRYSSNSALDELVAVLPQSNGVANYEAYTKILKSAGIEPIGIGPPLRVRLDDVFKYITVREYPPLLDQALTPKSSDSPLTYYVPTVIDDFKKASGQNPQTLFKIGLITAQPEEGIGEEIPYVSWMFRLGNSDVVGYSAGGHYDARLAMLHTVGATCAYEFRNSLPVA